MTISHPEDDDVVIVSVWLPLQLWNGNYLATGGGGRLAGEFEVEQAPGVALEYVAAATDAGYPRMDLQCITRPMGIEQRWLI